MKRVLPPAYFLIALLAMAGVHNLMPLNHWIDAPRR
jgi:hypothetical protein